MAVSAAFSASGAALVATLPADGLVRVVSARDLRERFRYLLPGAYFATLCGDTSLLAVAATHGTRHRVLLVNAARPRGSVIAEFAVSERVLRVLMSPTRLVVVTRRACDVFDMQSRRQLVSFATPDNPLGVAALAVTPPSRPASTSAAPPSRSTPCYLFLPSSSDSGDLASYDLRSLEVVGLVPAHEAAVTCAVASPDGRMLATASSRGTIVRVHAVPRGARLASFRRGSRPAALRSLAWLSPPATTDRPAFVGDAPIILAAAGESNTVHIFAKGLERPSASAAMAAAAGGLLSSMARGLFSGSGQAATATPRAAGDLHGAAGSGAPPRAAPGSRGSGAGSLGAAVGLDLALARDEESSTAVQRSSRPSFGAAMSEAMHAGLLLGGVEGQRAFAQLRRTAVDGRDAAPLAAMSLRWVAADDWACGIDADPKGRPCLEAVLVVESGSVLRFSVDGSAGGEGTLVGEGRVTVDDEDDEQGVRGGTGTGQGGGLDQFFGRSDAAHVVAPPPDAAAAPMDGGVLSSDDAAATAVDGPPGAAAADGRAAGRVPTASSTRRRSDASSAGAPSSGSSARNQEPSAQSAGGAPP